MELSVSIHHAACDIRAMTDQAATPRAALVTGAARRIGRVIALALAEAGYAVAIHARRSAAEADALAGGITGAGGGAAALRADLADHAQGARPLPAAAHAPPPRAL